MDCVAGSLLIYKLNDTGIITKDCIFNWFLLLTVELEKYHKCKKNQCYKYLNPYTILVTTEGKILLLDLQAQSNSFAMKKMQKPAMREHFVKPVIHIRENSTQFMDFYGLGKTIQFVLACTEDKVCLSNREVYMLSGIIDKCLNDNKKRKYNDLKQVQKELPKVRSPKIKVRKEKIVIAVFIALCLLKVFYLGKEPDEIKKMTKGEIEISMPAI